ncbi:MAG TPA: glutamate synthase subunit beta [Chitinophagales bacterium]
MGKSTGFFEYQRALPKKEAVSERVKHNNEFVTRYDIADLQKQSARCMNCGVPFCHSGCPLGNFIPEFNDAVCKENWQEAYNILKSTNNFPEFTGRLCPAPCESSCVLAINKPAVAIEEIEKHIIEIAFEKGFVKAHIPRLRSDKKVAVIGSGVAGLAAAAQLNYAGHSVTVFERDNKIGGLLRYGIPDFKLEKNVIDRRIQLMEEEGITFRCNTNVGENVSINELLREYDAVVLAIGSTIPRELNIKGRELKGVHFAMEFLTQHNKRVGDERFSEEEILATDKNVIVIGGGDTGSDCIGTANRQNAKSVTQFAYQDKPSSERKPNTVWLDQPPLFTTSTSHEEGCERLFSITTKEFVGDANGNLKALKIANVEWIYNADGTRKNYIEISDSEREISCELALVAIGFSAPQKTGLVTELDLELDARGNVKTKDNSYQTNTKKVFACGDMHRGQSLVVWAISEGRECARNVDEFLMGTSLLERKDESLLYA